MDTVDNTNGAKPKIVRSVFGIKTLSLDKCDLMYFTRDIVAVKHTARNYCCWGGVSLSIQ